MAIGDIEDEAENNGELFEDIHPEIRHVINIRRLDYDARNEEQLGTYVQRDLELNWVANLCILVYIFLYIFLTFNRRHNGHAQSVGRSYEAHPPFVVESPGHIQDNCATCQPASSEEADTNADIHFPIVSDTNLGTYAELRLAQENRSFYDGRSRRTASQPSAIAGSLSNFDNLPQEQAELMEIIRNQPHPEGTNRLDHTATVTAGRQSDIKLEHDLNSPLHHSAVTAYSIRDAMATVATAGQIGIPKEHMEEGIQSQHKDDADFSEHASGTGHGRRQRSMLYRQRMETRVEDVIEKDSSDDDDFLSPLASNRDAFA